MTDTDSVLKSLNCVWLFFLFFRTKSCSIFFIRKIILKHTEKNSWEMIEFQMKISDHNQFSVLNSHYSLHISFIFFISFKSSISFWTLIISSNCKQKFRTVKSLSFWCQERLLWNWEISEWHSHYQWRTSL